MHANSTEVSAGGVDEIGRACVILVHGGQSCAKEGTLEQCIGV